MFVIGDDYWWSCEIAIQIIPVEVGIEQLRLMEDNDAPMTDLTGFSASIVHSVSNVRMPLRADEGLSWCMSTFGLATMSTHLRSPGPTPRLQPAETRGPEDPLLNGPTRIVAVASVKGETDR